MILLLPIRNLLSILLNVENDDSGLAVKILFRYQTDSVSFLFSPSFYCLRHHSVR
jgi:hypothetical protein